MNRFLKNIIATVALLLWFTEAGAGGTVNVVQLLDGFPAKCAQGIRPEIEKSGQCTLRITDISTPYCVMEVSAIRLMPGDNAQSRKNAPNIDKTPIEVTKQDNDVYTFDMPAEPYDVEVTVNFTYRTFGLTINDVPVTGDILLNIFHDADSTVAYNGKGVVILKNPTVPINVKSSLGQDLTIYFKGDANTLQSVTTTGTGEKLTFATNPQYPGMLFLKAAEGKTKVIEGFASVEDLQEGLVWRSGDAESAEAVIGTYIKPITQNTTITPDADELDVDNLTPGEVVTPETPGDKTEVMNKVVDDMVYSLVIKDEDGNSIDVLAKEEDGSNSILLNTAIDETDMNNAQGEELGSEDFAKVFNGIAFRLAGGSGTIELEVAVPAESKLMVQVGDLPDGTLYEFSDTVGVVQIPYVCDGATNVYIYNGTPASADARGLFHAKVLTTPIKVVSVSISPITVQDSEDPGVEAAPSNVMSPVTSLTDVSDRGVFNPKDATLTDLELESFASISSELNCIDLSDTKITGIDVSRSSGPFKGVDAGTFIYLPAGNTNSTDEPNVIIGAVCKKMVLTGDDRSFTPAVSFGVMEATLERDYVEGLTSTVFLPFAVDKASADALGTFYTFAGIQSNGDAKLDVVTTELAAKTPYIFQKRAGGKVTVKNVSVTTEAAPSSFALKGTFDPITWTQSDLDAKAAGDDGVIIYGYAANDQAEGNIKAGDFVRVGAGASIKPYRAYLEVSKSLATGSRIHINWGDDATGIKDLNSSTVSARWYTLDGRRLQKAPVKAGLYIRSGKKVVIK